MSENENFRMFLLTLIPFSASNHSINYNFLAILRIMDLIELSEVFDD